MNVADYSRPTPVLPSRASDRRFGTESDVEALTGIKRRTLQKYRLLNIGPKYYKLSTGAGRGGAVRYDLSEVVTWIESGAVNPKGDG